MKIELNKTYRTRDGRKARVICVDRRSDYSIVALISPGLNNAVEDVFIYLSDGICSATEDLPLDLISEWVDKPLFDPETFPKWKWAAIDRDGTSWVFTDKPKKMSGGIWCIADVRDGRAKIDRGVQFTGNWEDSLVEL
jgi:hypothetical protein